MPIFNYHCWSLFCFSFVFAGLTPAEKKIFYCSFSYFFGAAAFWSGFDQSGGSLTLFARDFTNLDFFGYLLPVSYINLINPIFVVIFAPIFAGIWTNLALKNLDPRYQLNLQ